MTDVGVLAIADAVEHNTGLIELSLFEVSVQHGYR